MNKHIGRNDRCPCGSGKKYKKCFYLKDKAVESENFKYKRFYRIRIRQALLGFLVLQINQTSKVNKEEEKQSNKTRK